MLLVIVLAVVCVGGAELLACRFADPLLYERLTGPTRRGVEKLWKNAQSAAESLALSLKSPEATKPPEPSEELENQYAGAPAIWKDLDAAVPSLTQLQIRGEREILTGGSWEIIYFNQGDEAWSSCPYGEDTIGKYGCGPTVMAMAVASLTGQETDPAQMAQWARENGIWAKKSGSRLSLVEKSAQAFGFDAEPCKDFDSDRLLQELSAGKIAVALMTKGHFTQGGHFILLRGTTLEGQVLVADPNSRERSLAPWDPQLILDELSSSRNSGAPLWLLSDSPVSDDSADRTQQGNAP